jgi:NAD+ synthase (glutamine-hydrolysing)
MYHAAAVIHNRRIVATAYKQNLCRYRYYDETRYFRPGDTTTVATLCIGGVDRRVGFLIGEDLWDQYYPANPFRDAVNAGAQVVIVINASPFEIGKWNKRLELVRHHQRTAPLPMVYVNTTAIGDNLKNLILFDGRSFVMDGSGNMNDCAPIFKIDLRVVELDNRFCGRKGTISSWSAEEELYEALTFALREYCRQTGFRQVLLGISGGIDSALVRFWLPMHLGRQVSWE